MKIDYAYVESVLGKGLEERRKLAVWRLAGQVPSTLSSPEALAEVSGELGGDIPRVMQQMVRMAAATSEEKDRRQLYFDLCLLIDWLSRKEAEVYKRLGKSREEVDALMQLSEEDTEREWSSRYLLRDRCLRVKWQILEAEGKESDEGLVEVERLEHVYKRFNVPDSWKPL